MAPESGPTNTRKDWRRDPDYIRLRGIAIGYDIICGVKPRRIKERYQIRKVDMREKFQAFIDQLNAYLRYTGRPPLSYTEEDAYNRKAWEELRPVAAEALRNLGPYKPPEEYFSGE
ncbi:hypothetical protein [Marinobacter shengliensis]|uniref:hypothetical protein n=1 Tax=Marinobacter shengliensis TaxID=1389223 RepID=UPI001109D4AD|nr:hypothetical protein [Marinobacter shengliensis]